MLELNFAIYHRAACLSAQAFSVDALAKESLTRHPFKHQLMNFGYRNTQRWMVHCSKGSTFDILFNIECPRYPHI